MECVTTREELRNLQAVKFIAILCFCVCSAAGQRVCPRPAAGSQVEPPPDLLSREGGILETTLFFRSAEDAYSQKRYCYETATGGQSPTLRVNRGDTVVLHLKNEASESTG